MNISVWLSRLTDFLNLGKLITTGAPGIVLALALALWGASLARLPLLPANPLPELSASRGEEEVEGKEIPKLRYQRQLAFLDLKIDIQTREYRDLTASRDKKSAQVKAAEAQLVALAEQIKKAGEALTARATADSINGPELDTRLRELDKDHQKLEEELKPWKQKLPVLEQEQQTALEKLELSQSKRKAFVAEEVDSVSDFLTLVLNHLIALILLGWILGMLLNPVSRAIFLKIRLPGDRRRGESHLQESKDKKTKRLKDLRTTQTRLFELLEKKPPTYAEEAEIHQLTAEERDLSLPSVEEIRYMVRTQEPAFFIGRQIVSQEDWDLFVTTYYRWSELCANLALPLLILALVTWCQLGKGWWAILALVAGLGFGGLGTYLYRYFRTRTIDLITGRMLEWYRAQQHEEQKPLLVLQVLMLEVNKLLKTIEEQTEPRPPVA